jgi:carboxyl-terminal processing protease
MRLTTQRYFTPSGRCIQKDYGENRKDYYLEQYTRSDTSIRDTNSIKYTTKNGRIVYDGGGITPDIIIEIDTNLNYLQINTMMRKGWVNEFCFESSEILKIQNINSYKKIDRANISTDFIEFLKQKDSNFNLKLGAIEFNYLENLLLATISKNLWDNDIYYKVLSEEDEYIKRAIREF